MEYNVESISSHKTSELFIFVEYVIDVFCGSAQTSSTIFGLLLETRYFNADVSQQFMESNDISHYKNIHLGIKLGGIETTFGAGDPPPILLSLGTKIFLDRVAQGQVFNLVR